MTNDKKEPITDAEALAYHAEGKPGKISILPTKPLMTQRDLSLGYSPGVAIPCLEIQKDPSKAYDYTSRGNFVAVISNGTAVLGLGNLGALASKPVMEGKAILFKRFADIDCIDLEVDTTNVDEFVNCVKLLGPSWGGINLEDIAAPECFIIEQRLRDTMDIPVFHDDQHGTAIIVAAGLINAAHLTGRELKDIKVVVLGAGSAGIACLELIKRMGIKHENALLVDKTGVIYEGRTESMNQWKSAHAVKTDKRTLADAMKGADMFMGLAGKNAVSKEMVASMAKNPIIFAMANPDPEITPEDVRSVRSDAIIATGRSDYANQVNNVMGFPYIFRGALDVRASQINEDMKVAAAEAIAALAREDVPEEVSAAYAGRKMEYGSEYIIPAPFDPRLMTTVPVAVAKAAMKTGVARNPISDFAAYKKELAARRDPTANSMQHIFDKVRDNPQRMIFAALFGSFASACISRKPRGRCSAPGMNPFCHSSFSRTSTSTISRRAKASAISSGDRMSRTTMVGCALSSASTWSGCTSPGLSITDAAPFAAVDVEVLSDPHPIAKNAVPTRTAAAATAFATGFLGEVVITSKCTYI